MHRVALRAALYLSILLLTCSVAAKHANAQTQPQLSPEMQHKIDDLAAAALAKTGVPSASVAVIKDGHIAYLHAYGNARLDPQTAATPPMRYSIGSVSKQFTSASILLLQEEGKLSLDDKVGKFLPDLTRANDVTIREILSHTSGYQDYWPQDYVMPEMLEPTTARKILGVWARKPLDFEPGTKWQYSNTNYVIAGLIVEKASGQPLLQFLQQKIFTPLDMKSVADTDQAKLGDTDPAGYMRYAPGPLRPAPKEGTGWLFAAGELAMPAEDLAKWDVSIINQSLLKPASYRDFETEVLLANGLGTRYGLGVDVREEFGHRALEHSGEVSGFTSENDVYPDDHVAVVVLTNEDAAEAADAIAKAIAPLLLASDDPATPEKLAQAQKIFAGLQHGEIDRSLFTANANFYFSEQALKDFASSLGPLGAPQEFVQTRQALRGGMTLRVYSVKFAKIELQAWTYEMPDGKLEQFQVAPAD
ncbi:MAG: serine hydrolase domain-containing protein [Candidatus Acidiferrales bacterium]